MVSSGAKTDNAEVSGIAVKGQIDSLIDPNVAPVALRSTEKAVLRFEEPSRKRHVKLDPALRAWLDNVIIPALVREYLAEIEKQNRLATPGSSEVTSD